MSAGTSTGTVTVWKLSQGNTITKPSSINHLNADPSMQWVPQRGLTMAGCVDSIAWGPNDRCATRLTMCAVHASPAGAGALPVTDVCYVSFVVISARYRSCMYTFELQ